jgi:UbiD family decarboxylase
MDLREILSRIEKRNLKEEVDPYLEASRECRADPLKAWIAQAKGHPGWRIAGNVYSTRDTLSMALSTDNPGVTDSMMEGASDPEPVTIIKMPDEYREVSVENIPFPTYFPGDGGPYVSSGIFHAAFGDKRNLSFHRMMHMGGNRFAVRVVPRHLKALMKMAEDAGRSLESVVSIGADPYSLLAGSTSLGFGEDELEVASSLKKKATGNPLEVFEPGKKGIYSPKGTELVLTGRFTGEKAPEGPFVDITSTYDLAGLEPGEPVFEVTRAFARKEPIMHVLLPGGLEHYLMMGLPKEPSIKSSVKKIVPTVNGVRLTEGGCCWLHGVISIKQQKQGDSKNAIMAAFTGHPSMKRVIVVDEDIDIYNDREIEWALATRFQADRDLVIVKGARGSTLDPSSRPDDLTTTKMGMDATIPLGREKEFIKVDE